MNEIAVVIPSKPDRDVDAAMLSAARESAERLAGRPVGAVKYAGKEFGVIGGIDFSAIGLVCHSFRATA